MSIWNKEADYLLLYMRYIGIEFRECADIMNREWPASGFGRNSLIGRHNRLIKNGIKHPAVEQDNIDRDAAVRNWERKKQQGNR